MAIVIRKASTEQETLDWSGTHRCHVSADDIILLVEPINTENEEKYKAAIDGKEYIRDTRAKFLLMPCNQNAGHRVRSRQPVPRFKKVAKLTTFEGTYEVETALMLQVWGDLIRVMLATCLFGTDSLSFCTSYIGWLFELYVTTISVN